MKATGITRRIDELGRIVIPKELRRVMGIAEGDQFEIYLNRENGGIVMKKYVLEASIKESLIHARQQVGCGCEDGHIELEQGQRIIESIDAVIAML